MTGAVTIAPADPTMPAARALIAALDHYLGGLYGAEDNHLLDPERLRAPDIRFLLAVRDGVAMGCGALRLDVPGGYAEIKRMYVDPACRGQGVASAILSALAQTARASGLLLLKLETGERQVEAVALYRRLGFTPCASFAEYPCNGASLFLEKRLD
ncbi:GNAT family N-acetyltransferase [Niveispirillum fermenti]|uniref:GNAT family N-acetyltransferase n=1 Tax=Niveispirillum fermenti TaxID=1233113 RepID=UPI003A857FC5